MTWFEDLTRYRYFVRGNRRARSYNIGWLDKDHSFPQRKSSKVLISRLLNLCSVRVNSTRGLHPCYWCKKYITAAFRGQKLKLGSAEIRVFGDDKIYAAPNLIYHYVAEHNYRPPQEFLNALRKTPLATTQEYLDLLKEKGVSFPTPITDAEMEKLLAENEKKTKMALAAIRNKANLG